MKRLFFTVCLLASAITFSACGGGDDSIEDPKDDADKEKPIITVPTKADGSLHVFDLGDNEAKLLEGVTASDKVDGDLTASVKVSGSLERVGKTQLKYKVSDKAGNVAELTRDVIVSARKLCGTYGALGKRQDDTTRTFSYTMDVFVDRDTVLVLKKFQNLPDNIKARFAGDCKFALEETSTSQNGRYPTITGTLTFGDNTKGYKVANIHYTFAYLKEIGQPEEVWFARCTFVDDNM